VRVVALIASYNEQRFIASCLEHLHEQGVESYLIDNGSTDDTVEIAEGFFDRGLIGIEEYPREGVYDWRGLLERKEELAAEFAREREADWLIHVDPDEVRMAPGEGTLAEGLAAVDRAGHNAVNFLECTFVPSREDPDHDHPEFPSTLRTYYPFCPFFPHRLNAWKAADAPQPNLVSSGGHRVAFHGLSMHPRSFPMKHYLFLSVPHAVEKYVDRQYRLAEVKRGWHGWRADLRAEDIRLPSESELRVAAPGEELDPSQPRQRHFIDDLAVRG
jgi:glycosyltransferase involved in cell wall biosynthesis